MRRQTKVAVVALLLIASAGAWWVSAQTAAAAQKASQQTAPRRDYPVQPVPFTAVHLDDVFWAPRIETNRAVTHPVRLPAVRADGPRRQLRARRRRAARRGADQQEAARLSLRRHRSLQGDRRRVLHAQRAARSEARRLRRRADREDRRRAGDGRLPLHDAHHRSRSIRTPGPAPSAGSSRRWTATSSTTSATCTRPPSRTTRPPASGRCSTSRSGRPTCSTRTFGPGKQVDLAGPPDHRDGTGEAVPRHRRAAVSQPRQVPARRARARTATRARAATYNQSQPKVVEQTEAVGHAVRATYMYSGMADVAALTGDAAYVEAIDTIWDNVVGEEALHHRRHRRHRPRRGVRRRLRAAEHDRVQRDLRRRSATTSGTTGCSCCTPTRSTST